MADRIDAFGALTATQLLSSRRLPAKELRKQNKLVKVVAQLQKVFLAIRRPLCCALYIRVLIRRKGSTSCPPCCPASTKKRSLNLCRVRAS